MRHYEIGQIGFSFQSANEDCDQKLSFFELEAFRRIENDRRHFAVSLQTGQPEELPEVSLILGEDSFATDSRGRIISWRKTGNTKCITDLNAHTVNVLSFEDSIRFDLKTQISIAYSSFLAEKNGLFMHGPILNHKGKGVIFTAPSGGGKSTQANYWVDCFCDELINGDKALVRFIDGKPIAFGSPWSGSSCICKNESVPLKAIVLIEKSRDNSIERVTDAQRILSVLAPNVYYPYWSDELVDQTMNTMEELIGSVSFWILKCRNEKESALLAERSIFGEDSDA